MLREWFLDYVIQLIMFAIRGESIQYKMATFWGWQFTVRPHSLAFCIFSLLLFAQCDLTFVLAIYSEAALFALRVSA